MLTKRKHYSICTLEIISPLFYPKPNWLFLVREYVPSFCTTRNEQVESIDAFDKHFQNSCFVVYFLLSTVCGALEVRFVVENRRAVM